ncbi:C-C motif chemokine 36.1 [Megalops cyprinoides]|uniref:C-C motif chemokine 36.1 n=1 Tax=Megalops cyprinoides TaxID=118141 RepID=UPI0018649BC9|nr:C-C motif chemokine 36.1 [Megalops cyprinoides]
MPVISTRSVAVYLCSLSASEDANMPSQCCFEYFPQRIGKQFVQKYVKTRSECSKPGVIFVTRRSKRLCVDPSVDWVKGVMKDLDRRLLI